ncbi:MAG: hypothetical protein WBJ37_11570 [Bacteroidales bacterium]
MNKIKSHPLYRKHDLDSAMSSLLNFLKKHFWGLFFIALIISLISQYAILLFDFNKILSITDPEEIVDFVRSNILPFAGILVLSLYFNVVLSYFVLNKPLDSSVNVFSSFWRSLRYIIPYLIIIIIFSFVGSFVLVLGLLALFIGALFALLYLLMISFFILPVMMCEGDNIGIVMARTIKLSHRNFWANLGWSAVVILIYIVISVVLSGIIMIPFTGSFIKSIMNPQDVSSVVDIATNPVMLTLSAISSALLIPIFPVFAFILYFNARAREDIFEVENYPQEPDNKIKVEDLYSLPEKKDEEQ